LRRTCKCTSLLSFCAPCIWSFLQNHLSETFYETINIQQGNEQVFAYANSSYENYIKTSFEIIGLKEMADSETSQILELSDGMSHLR